MGQEESLTRPVIRMVLSACLAVLCAGPAQAQKAEINAAARPAAVVAGGRAEIRVTFTFARDLHQTRQEEYFFARLEGVRPGGGGGSGEGFVAGPPVYPRGSVRDGVVSYDSPVTLMVPLDVAVSVPAGRYVADLRAGYQLCNDSGLCYFPDERLVSADLEVLPPARRSGNLLIMLLMAFVGGLILNVMPCVLPMLSIKALSLVRDSGSDGRRMLLSALSYAGGIVASFLALAAVVAALKASGELVGWGFQFQNPGYVVALLGVLFVFALSLFDVFTVSLPGAGLAGKASGAGGYLGSFLTGAMAVLLATPCTAPFLGTALGYAFSQPAPTIFLLFAVVGLGLASPFVLLGLWPAAVRLIPKPGPWTAVFRTVMGFLLMGTAVYLLDVLGRQLGVAGVVRAVAFLMVLGVAAWVYGRFGGPTVAMGTRVLALAAAVAISVVGGIVTLRFEPPEGREAPLMAEPAAALEGWEPFRPHVVEGYLAEGRPVFLAFGARWCLTCRTNESVALGARDVLEAFELRGVRLVYGDYTNPDEAVGQWLRRHGRAGVPLYVYYPGGGAEAIVLPEIITRKMVLELL